MALSIVSKKSVLMSMLACVLAAASVACGSADGEHPYMSESSVSAASTPGEELCTPGAVESCRQYFTAYGTTNCIPGFRECGEDQRWSECGQGLPDSGAAQPTK